MTADRTRDIAEIRICSDPGELARVRKRIQAESRAVGFAEDIVGEIALAVDEALSNVIRHGYGGPCDRPIDVKIERLRLGDDREIRITVRDYGRQVDPAEINPRAIENVQPGGLGVHIIKTVMDEVVYSPAEGGGMRLIMRKTKPR